MNEFAAALALHGLAPLTRVAATATLQINVGKVCNQACHHCHVEAGPKRTESMTAETARRVIELLAASPSITTVDITGGAPEINSNFRWLVEQSRRLAKHVIDRCNLTILLEPGHEDLGQFLAGHGVEIIASMPCYTKENVDLQRGRGVFEKSIQALLALNALGYGMPGSGLELNLVYNPGGASLPPPQAALESDYKRRLQEDFGIAFNRLFTIINMPISRFAEYLSRTGKAEAYAKLLADHFNPGTVPGLMCRSLVSVGWDGLLYDCDFNQMLEIPSPAARTIHHIESFTFHAEAPVATASHCFGCTAGAGSSCGGVLA